jgi:protein-tyrosine phosphatase
MAEFIMKKVVSDNGKQSEYYISSAATSKYEAGMGVHHGTRKILDRLGISYEGKRSITLRADDYEKYDYIIGMDAENKSNMLRLFGGDKDKKVGLLLEYAGKNRDVADPYWTGDFEATYRDVVEGTNALFNFIESKKQ